MNELLQQTSVDFHNSLSMAPQIANASRLDFLLNVYIINSNSHFSDAFNVSIGDNLKGRGSKAPKWKNTNESQHFSRESTLVVMHSPGKGEGRRYREDKKNLAY